MKKETELFKGTYQEMVKELNRTQYKAGFWAGTQAATTVIMLAMLWLKN